MATDCLVESNTASVYSRTTSKHQWIMWPGVYRKLIASYSLRCGIIILRMFIITTIIPKLALPGDLYSWTTSLTNHIDLIHMNIPDNMFLITLWHNLIVYSIFSNPISIGCYLDQTICWYKMCPCFALPPTNEHIYYIAIF